MKAKIFHAVDIAEIPKELQKMLKVVESELNKTLENNETSYHVLNLNMQKPQNIDCCIESVNSTRLKLAEIDKTLTDSVEFLNGFKNYVIQNSQQSKEELVKKAVASHKRQIAEEQAVSDPIPAGHENCDAEGGHSHENATITKEMLQRLAELKDANKG